MKKFFKFLSGILAISCLGTSNIIINAVNTTDELNNLMYKEATFDNFDFIVKALDEVTDIFLNTDIDIRTCGDCLNLENPSESYVEVVVGSEKAAEEFINAIKERGISTDIFQITVNPDLWLTLEGANKSAFNNFDFIVKALDETTDIFLNTDIDIRTYGDCLNLENPSASYIEVVVGSEKAAEKFINAIKERGISTDIFKIIVNSDLWLTLEKENNIKGDINIDRKIDIRDVAMYSQCLVKLTEVPNNALADIDEDGEVGIKDLMKLKSYLIHDIDTL